MINIDLGPVAGQFCLAGTYSWEEAGKPKTAAFNVTMKWSAEFPDPVVSQITWVDLIPDEKARQAEPSIHRYLEDGKRTFSIIYH